MTMADLLGWLDEEGAGLDEEIKLFSGPNEEVFVLSVYRNEEGTLNIDVGDE